MAAERRKKTAVRKGQKKVVSRRGGSKRAAKTAVSPAPYRCSKCGFREGLEDPDWSDPRTSIRTSDLGNPKCYELCPAEGPTSGYLADAERLHMRYRQEFQTTTGSVRACIPFGVVHRGPKGGEHIGIAVGCDRVQREIYLNDYLSHHGPDSDVDLHHADASAGLGDQWFVNKTGDRWALPQRFPSARRDDPYGRLLFEFRNRHPEHRGRCLEVMAALDSRLGDDAKLSDRFLNVPIDLRRPIDEQLERAGAVLKDVREYLYRFVKGGAPRERKNLTRDTYIYLLREIEELSAADIAARIFSHEIKKSRIHKVHVILQQVRAALAQAPPLRRR